MITEEMFQDLQKRVEKLECAVFTAGKSIENAGNTLKVAGFIEASKRPLSDYTQSGKTISVPNNWHDIYVGQLHHRFLRAQFVSMITSEDGFNPALRSRGYRYAFEQTIKRLKEAQHLHDHGNSDVANVMCLWFNNKLARDIVMDYYEIIRKLIDNAKVCHNKKEDYDYKVILGRNYKVDNIKSTLLGDIQNYAARVLNASTLSSTASILREFMRKHPIYKKWKMPKCFIEAYKGWGAYSAMREFVRFDNCCIITDNGCTINDKNSALAQIKFLNGLYSAKNEGYKMCAAFKKMMEDNEINLEEKLKSWRKTDI